MRAIKYAFDEAILSLWRGKTSGVLSTATIALALFVLGAFLIVTSNLQRLGDEWSQSAEMSVYLSDTVTDAERGAIEAAIAQAGSIVAAREYVSKAEALVRFKRTFSELAGALEGLGQEPLPASYELRLQRGAESSVDAFAATLTRLPGIADVRYDKQWLTRLIAGVRVIRGMGLVLGAILTIAAALTVANVVRLALHARRDELEIMQLVGAPQLYIRGPFVMEGTLQGGIGAVVAVLALAGVFVALRGRYLVPLASAVNLSGVQFLPAELWLLMIVGGMAVGCVGGLVAGFAQS
jgi:cell division transport system permease protein